MTKRSRPSQHRRRLSSGRVITVNKGLPKRKVYKRRMSKSSITYKPTGFVRTAYDKQGRFQGSKIIKTPSAKNSSSKKKEIYREEIKRLDNNLATGKISIDEYNKKLTNLLLE